MTKKEIPRLLREELDKEYKYWEGQKTATLYFSAFKRLERLIEIVHRDHFRYGTKGEALLTVIQFLEEKDKENE